MPVQVFGLGRDDLLKHYEGVTYRYREVIYYKWEGVFKAMIKRRGSLEAHQRLVLGRPIFTRLFEMVEKRYKDLLLLSRFEKVVDQFDWSGDKLLTLSEYTKCLSLASPKFTCDRRSCKNYASETIPITMQLLEAFLLHPFLREVR